MGMARTRPSPWARPYDTMAAAKEGCAAVQRAADGADVVEADRWQQVAAWLSGWAWRRVWRPAGLEAVV